jgi:hypothetical protein
MILQHKDDPEAKGQGEGSGLVLMRRFSCQEQRARGQERMEGYVNARPDPNPQNRREVLDLLDGITRAAGKTLIMVTHSPEVMGLADRILTIKQGRILEQ